jgi:erythromycin esterase-like protein
MASKRRYPAAALALLLAAAACGAPSPLPAAEKDQPAPAAALEAIRASAHPLTGGANDYDDVVAAIGDAHRVLLGESTHGTHEYYRERARISSRLIREKGFNAVAIEGDWSPVWRLNLYVRGLGKDKSADEALAGFTGFPKWMWGNAEFRDFVESLRAYNLSTVAIQRVGLYGFDVYDFFGAADNLRRYMAGTGTLPAPLRALSRCLSPFNRDPHAYGSAARIPGVSCRKQAEAALAEVQKRPIPADPEAAEHHFAALMSAHSVVAAEEYFRTVYAGSMAWNARDTRMAQNVESIAAHVGRVSGKPAKLLIWSHNSHSGDARATSAANRGELNLGQLMRQRHGTHAFLTGLFTDRGTVLATSEWDRPGRAVDLRPSLPASFGALFREAKIPAYSMVLRGNIALASALAGPRLQRAVGVVYKPSTERQSHYFEADLPRQFDAAIFFETTKAVTPLRR